MKRPILFFAVLGILLRLIGLALYIATIVQVWGGGFWRTALTMILVGLSSIYWAYQWWHGFGWNFSSIVLIFLIVNAAYLIVDKLLTAALGVEED